MLDHLFPCPMQEGFSALWRGTNAGLALAIPTVSFDWSFLKYDLLTMLLLWPFGNKLLYAQLQWWLVYVFKQVGIYLPCYDIFRNKLEEFTARNAPGLTPYIPLVAGALARSLACTSCYPIELARTRMQVIYFSCISINLFFTVVHLSFQFSHYNLLVFRHLSISKVIKDHQACWRL